jgi:translation initiation factor 1 (eIF-1/SUI1)
MKKQLLVLFILLVAPIYMWSKAYSVTLKNTSKKTIEAYLSATTRICQSVCFPSTIESLETETVIKKDKQKKVSVIGACPATCKKSLGLTITIQGDKNATLGGNIVTPGQTYKWNGQALQ